jgi:psiF repeat-containing protein
MMIARRCTSFLFLIGASMIAISTRALGLAFAASLLLATPTFAQTAAPAKTEKAEKPRTAASIECSKEADAKGLHGKERKKFRSECKKEKGGTAAPATK